MIYLRQSTASQEIPLGYFLDSADGNTEETGLTIANTDIKLWKTGATTLADKNSGGATHISNGIYYAVLDATDTDTLGSLVIFVHVAGALAIRLECVVLAANIYDSMIAASDNLQIDLVQAGGSVISQSGGLLNANVTQISGDSTAADNFETMLDGTGGQTLSLGQLNIVNSAGSAIVASSTGGNGHGIAASGNGSGEGISATGGATGHGMELIGGATSGNGLTTTATAGNSHGIRSTGQGSGEGMSLLGGATGHGLEATGQGTGAAGIRAVGSGANTTGMSISGPVGIQVNATSSIGVSIGGQTHGIYATSATNGHGIYAQGGISGGNGINVEGQAGNGHGLRAAGQGSGEGISAVGGNTGHGIEAQGGASGGNGLSLIANANNTSAMRAQGNGSGHGINAIGGSSGDGVRAESSATGNGINAISGAAGGNGINAVSQGGNGHGMSLSGEGSGHGLTATGGATGNGIDANGGATSGNGIDAAAPTSGDGMSLTGAGAGLDLDAAVNELTAAALGQYFTVDSGETFGTAVAGSVVRETAGNATVASIGASVLNDIADAILRRDWTAVAAPASRSVMNALRAIRNRVAVAAGTLTVYEEDDATPAYTAVVTTNAAANPITEIDPT